jgi:hypothetical protein
MNYHPKMTHHLLEVGMMNYLQVEVLMPEVEQQLVVGLLQNLRQMMLLHRQPKMRHHPQLKMPHHLRQTMLPNLRLMTLRYLRQMMRHY